jgi:predicted nucleic-acid-binding protein
MIGLDTNVLVRYLMQDDPEQAALAARVIDALTPEEPGYIPLVVLAETVWVLTRHYKVPRERIADALELLLHARELVVEGAETARAALRIYRDTRVEFADSLIAQSARAAGCSEILTFDERAAAAVGMRLLIP